MGKQSVRSYSEMSKEVNGNNVVEIAISYRKAGYNTFHGNHERGGIEVCVNPMKRSVDERGIVSTSYMLFANNGFRILVEELSRFSQKKLDRAVSIIEPIKGQIVEFMEREDKQGAANLIFETFRKAA